MEIFKLFGSIFVDNDKANQSIDATDKKGQGLAATLGSGIGKAAKWGAAIGAGALVAGGAMLAMANKTAEYADEIDKLSERTGINREELQRWKYAAEQSGADIGKLEVGVKTLSDQMDKAINGNKTAVESFDKIGISIDDLKNKSQEEIFSAVAASLADMEQGAQRNALGNDLLGKSYTELMPLLNAGSEGMDALKTRAGELNLVMSEDAVKANVKFGDTLADVKSAFGAIFMQVSNEFLPILQTLLDWIIAYMPQIQKVMGTVFDAIGAFVKTAGEIFTNYLLPIIKEIYEWIQDNWPEIQAIGEKVFGAIFKIIERVWGLFKNQLLPILKALYDFVAPTFPIIGKIIEEAFDIVVGIVNTAITAFEGVLKLINGVINAFKSIKSVVSNAIDAVSKGATVKVDYDESGLQGLATGTPYVSRGGRFIVGEAGPEEVFLPRGAAVVPAGGGGTNIFNIYGNNAEEVWALLYDKLIDAGVIA